MQSTIGHVAPSVNHSLFGTTFEQAALCAYCGMPRHHEEGEPCNGCPKDQLATWPVTVTGSGKVVQIDAVSQQELMKKIGWAYCTTRQERDGSTKKLASEFVYLTVSMLEGQTSTFDMLTVLRQLSALAVKREDSENFTDILDAIVSVADVLKQVRAGEVAP